MQDLTISLIIPVYNAANDLEHLFESLLWQTRPFDEIILVDNQSKDRSLDICKDFQQKNPDRNIIVFTESRKGPSAVRNAGFKKSSSEILALTDADCILEKDWCKNVLYRFKNDITYDIIGGIAAGTEIFGKDQTFETYVEEYNYYYWTINRQSSTAYPMNQIDDFFSRARFTIATYNVAIKRAVFEETEGFDEKLLNNEDTDWWMRCTLKGFKSLVGIPDIKVCHRNRKELKSLYRQYYNYGEGLPYLLKKYFRGRFFVTFRSIKILEIPFLTGVMEINPHTLLLLLLILHIFWLPIIWYPLYFLLLIALRYWLIHRYIKKFTRATFQKVLAFIGIMETRQIAWSLAAIKGSFIYKALCII